VPAQPSSIAPRTTHSEPPGRGASSRTWYKRMWHRHRIDHLGASGTGTTGASPQRLGEWCHLFGEDPSCPPEDRSDRDHSGPSPWRTHMDAASSEHSRRQQLRTEGSSPPPSASLAIRDILFTPLDTGRNPAECRPLGSFIRTTRTGSEAHFGPFPVSLRPHSLTQPNHAHFGTVIGTSTDQRVRGSPKERSLEEPPSGEGNTARTVRYRYGPSS
jgi:hypothetical protein